MRFFSMIVGAVLYTSTAIAVMDTPDAFLKRIYFNAYGLPAPEKILAPTLAELWRQSLALTRETEKRGAASATYFGCPDGNYPSAKITIKAGDDPYKALATVIRTCGKTTDTATIKVAKFDDQWRITDYTDSNGDMRKRLTEHIAEKK